jgi:hypothetical protein
MCTLRIATLAVLSLSVLALSREDPPVGIEMRNVHLRVSDRAALDVAWLRGRLRTTKPGHPPVFDDQQSFVMEVDDAEIAMDAASLSTIVNAAFDYKGSNLSDLRIAFEEGQLVQRGTLKKGVSVPFTVRADVTVTPEGLLTIHPVKVKAAGMPAAKLMSLFSVELDDIIKSRPERGVRLRENDFLLDPAKMLPPPQIRGKLATAAVRGNRFVQTFGRGRASEPRSARGNYIWFRGNTIRFGKLTMSDTDLQLLDMDPKDPFDFYSARYSEQLIAGYSKNTRTGGLRSHMPDASDLRK